MKTIIWIFTVLAIPCVASSPLNVAAGNPLGESAAVTAEQGFLPIPQVGGVNAKRMDKNVVKVTWTAAVLPGTGEFRYAIFRTTDNMEGWAKIGELQTNNNIEYIDATAPAPHRYRYVVCLKHTYVQAADGEITVYSEPSAENENTIVDYAQATIAAGGVMYFDMSDEIPPPDGHFTVSDFIPEDYEAGFPPVPPPNPYVLSGTFDEVVIDGSPYIRYKGEAGYFPKGKTLSASARVVTSKASIGEFPYLTLESPDPWTGLVPGPTVEDTGTHFILELASQFGFYNCDFASIRFAGFDFMTNPKTQFIRPGEDEKIVVMKVAPTAPDTGTPFPIIAQAPAQVNEGALMQGSKNVIVSATAAGNAEISVGTLKPILRVQSLPHVEIRVAIVPVITSERDAQNQLHPIAAAIMSQDPNVIKINEVMDLTFLRYANVKVTCFAVPAQQVDDSDDDNPKSDHGALDIGKALDFQRLDDLRGVIMATYPCEFVIFWVNETGDASGGATLMQQKLITVKNRAPGNSGATFPEPYTCAHELGHALGLQHPWRYSTPYDQQTTPDDPSARVMGYGTPVGAKYFLPAEKTVIRATINGLP